MKRKVRAYNKKSKAKDSIVSKGFNVEKMRFTGSTVKIHRKTQIKEFTGESMYGYLRLNAPSNLEIFCSSLYSGANPPDFGGQQGNFLQKLNSFLSNLWRGK